MDWRFNFIMIEDGTDPPRIGLRIDTVMARSDQTQLEIRPPSDTDSPKGAEPLRIGHAGWKKAR